MSYDRVQYNILGAKLQDRQLEHFDLKIMLFCYKFLPPADSKTPRVFLDPWGFDRTLILRYVYLCDAGPIILRIPIADDSHVPRLHV